MSAGQNRVTAPDPLSLKGGLAWERERGAGDCRGREDSRTFLDKRRHGLQPRGSCACRVPDAAWGTGLVLSDGQPLLVLTAQSLGRPLRAAGGLSEAGDRPGAGRLIAFLGPSPRPRARPQSRNSAPQSAAAWAPQASDEVSPAPGLAWAGGR